jgi:hypothetical protein
MAAVPELDIEQLTVAVVVLAALSVLALVTAFVCLGLLRRARRSFAVLRGDAGEQDVVAAVAGALTSFEALQTKVEALAAAQNEQALGGRFALQRVGLVRYDAFDDMGGRMSFSAALLNEHGDGLVLTSINGRTESRSYAKTITGLASEHNLSAEERDAIAQASGAAVAVRPRRASTG